MTRTEKGKAGPQLTSEFMRQFVIRLSCAAAFSDPRKRMQRVRSDASGAEAALPISLIFGKSDSHIRLMGKATWSVRVRFPKRFPRGTNCSYLRFILF